MCASVIRNSYNVRTMKNWLDVYKTYSIIVDNTWNKMLRVVVVVVFLTNIVYIHTVLPSMIVWIIRAA